MNEFEAGNTLDETIAVEIFEYIRLPFPAVPHLQKPTKHGVEAVYYLDNYSGSWGAAGKVIQKMQELGFRCELGMDFGCSDKWHCTFDGIDGYGYMEGVPAPLAICVSALNALSSKNVEVPHE